MLSYIINSIRHPYLITYNYYKMLRLLITVCSILLIFTNTSCNKEVELPTCIEDRLETFKTEACSGDELTRWRFNGRDVYCFAYGECDANSRAEIFETDCTFMCTLFDVATGNTRCESTTWTGNAKLRETVYRHP